MKPCESIAVLFPLSAAGLLDPAEERAVREHVRECPQCASHLESLGNLAGALAALPAPAPPLHLALRTQARLAVELEATADRRRGGVLAMSGAALAWISYFAMWAVYRILTGGVDTLFQPQLPSLWIWLAASVLMAFLAAPMAAALVSARRRIERRVV